ncbi:MAG: hypothetical protein EXX96DRAFT_565714 [Benjaminiella poitrasii]|nr:MAG: hypothetical protein EXX96DRAFT_565714 [Benjaminiella poitrasii]
MSYIERIHTLCWRLDWSPGGRPQPCLYHPNAHFSRSYAIRCLHMHQCLFLPISIEVPLSSLLKLLPTIKPRQSYEALSWFVHWLIV